jgi:glucose/arabinose dehydrogenase
MLSFSFVQRATATFVGVAGFALAGCGSSATLPVVAGTGPHPVIPPPTSSLIPTVLVADARGWAPGAAPHPAAGMTVTAFADRLDHPRWLYVLPNGDVLVAETNAPPKPEDNKGIKGWFFKRYQKKAGAAVPSANRITLLRDADGDGVAETRSVLLDNLRSPFGMVLVGNTLYVANSDALVRFPYVPGQLRITAPAAQVVALPAGPINHHWTKNVVASSLGNKLYVSVGSNSNVAENGIEAEEGRAAIWEVDVATGSHRVFASGMRNPVGMTWVPETQAMGRFTDGRTVTMGRTSTLASSRSDSISWRPRSGPTMRSGRTPAHSVWCTPSAPPWLPRSTPGCSWASMARGIASPAVATR